MARCVPVRGVCGVRRVRWPLALRIDRGSRAAREEMYGTEERRDEARGEAEPEAGEKKKKKETLPCPV